MRRFMLACAMALAVTACAPTESQAGGHGCGPVRTAIRNAAERWRDRLSRAGRMLAAVSERIVPVVEVRMDRDRPAFLLSYRINPAACRGGKCEP